MTSMAGSLAYGVLADAMSIPPCPPNNREGKGLS